MNYICQKNLISIRKMEDCLDDYLLLVKWLSDPAVLEYYEGRSNPFDLEKVKEKFAHRTRGESSVIPCIIEHNEKAVGYIQYYKTDLGEYDVTELADFQKYIHPYALDVFIGETDYWNKGIGTEAIKILIKYMFESENADVIFIDPQTWNKRAVRCYEKCGFKAVKIIEKRELHDGEYKDSLIMFISRT